MITKIKTDSYENGGGGGEIHAILGIEVRL